MGKRRRGARQRSMWVATTDLPRSAAHPFYARLNQILDDAGFDRFVETVCAKFYAAGVGRPGLAPGRYFRLLLLGYFEGLDSERAIAWRAADSLSIRHFLDLELAESPPDHSTVSRTRRLMDVETHAAVFTWVLQRLADAQLVQGRTIGIDAMPWCITPFWAESLSDSACRSSGHLAIGCPERRHGVEDLAPQPHLDSLGRESPRSHR